MNKFQKLTGKIQTAFKRFPISIGIIAFSTLSTLYFFNFIDKPESSSGNAFLRITLSSIVLFLLVFPIELLKEKQGKLNPKKLIAYSIFAVVTFIYFQLALVPSNFEFFNLADFYKYVIFFAALYFLSPIVVFNKKEEDRVFWGFADSYATATIYGYFFSFLLFVGFLGAFAASRVLLEIEWGEKVYMNTAILFFNLLGPIFSLSLIANLGDIKHFQDYPKQFLALVKFVLIPIVIVYNLILNLYILRIIFTSEIPENNIVYLVLSFLAPGFFALGLIYPKKNELNWVNKYLKFYSISSLPLIILYFYAIGARIIAFGFTVDRLVILLVGIWVLFVLSYLLIAKNPRFFILYTSLIAIFVFSAFTPYFNIFTLSESSQSGRVKDNFEAVSDLEDEQEKSKKVEEIESQLNYLGNYHGYNSIKDQFTEDEWEELDLLDNGFPTITGNYYATRTILEFKNLETKDFPENNISYEYFNYNLDYCDIYPLNIEGFGVIDSGIIYNNQYDRSAGLFGGKQGILLDSNNNLVISTASNSSTVIRINLEDIVKDFEENGEECFDLQNNLIIERSLGSDNLKIIIRGLNGNKENEIVKVDTINFMILK
jgi:hypothetical protein